MNKVVRLPHWIAVDAGITIVGFAIAALVFLHGYVSSMSLILSALCIFAGIAAARVASDLWINRANNVTVKASASTIQAKDEKPVFKIGEISINDLLGRDPIITDMNRVCDYIKNRVVLITGAGGSIGSELCRQVAGLSPQMLLLLGHGENSIYLIEQELKERYANVKTYPIIADIQDAARLEEIFSEYRPEIVFHAAAHKHVPLMEVNPLEAVKNNVLGTQNVAEASLHFGVRKFVLISSDKAVNPTSIMGATKRAAEMIIQQMNGKGITVFTTVRFGNVLGSRGSVLPLFQRQISQGGPVTVTHRDMVRYFMTIPEAVQLVLQAGGLAQGGEIFILDMGQPVKILDLATALIRLSGFEPGKDIQIKFTGLRGGEKMFEELLTAEEGLEMTVHERIFVGKAMNFKEQELKQIVSEFKWMSSEGGTTSAAKVKGLLNELIPTYACPESKEESHLALKVIS
ncbi:UDP-N-acetylglucosamine 4,6-dehydratase family protein [Cohnella yongneupensis]|uniref:UDP-N-acetylglucosamine 4,6-dehydratase family protein n=1 Tax=Cohnella yongneupensis TaxID=425006 RepID=A0ABW0R5B3_9BACL